MAKKLKANPTCPDCGGTGEVSIPAHVEAGEIVDEEVKPCICTIGNTKVEEEDEDDDT